MGLGPHFLGGDPRTPVGTNGAITIHVTIPVTSHVHHLPSVVSCAVTYFHPHNSWLDSILQVLQIHQIF